MAGKNKPVGLLWLAIVLLVLAAGGCYVSFDLWQMPAIDLSDQLQTDRIVTFFSIMTGVLLFCGLGSLIAWLAKRG